jgi:putative ABC transport system substrate-binding protein
MTPPGRRRRRALLGLAAAAALLPLTPRAEGPKRIIWLGYGEEFKKRVREGFRSRGILEGRDITLTFQQLPDGMEKASDELAERLVRSRPDIIVMVAHPALWPLKKRTRDIAIIFYDSGPNPAQVGLVESLARPGGNITGSAMTNDQHEYELRRWGRFKQLVPSLKRVANLVGKDFVREVEGRDPTWYAESKKILWGAGAELGIEFFLLEIPKEATRDEIANMVKASGAQAVILQPYAGREAAEFVYSAPIPTFCWGFAPVRKGCLVGFGFSGAEGESYAVLAAARVVRGESPAVIPVYVHNIVEFALNRRRARELGIDVPASFLIQAAEVFE